MNFPCAALVPASGLCMLVSVQQNNDRTPPDKLDILSWFGFDQEPPCPASPHPLGSPAEQALPVPDQHADRLVCRDTTTDTLSGLHNKLTFGVLKAAPTAHADRSSGPTN